MYFGLANPELYLYGVLFLLAALFSWFIPGWVVLTWARVKDPILRFLAAMPVGLALWGIQGYLLGYAQLRILTVLYIAIFALLFLQQWRVGTLQKDLLVVWRSLRKQPLWLGIAVAISSFLQIYAHLGSGLLTPAGLPFYFVNSVDGIMHLSYIQSLIHTFPPQEPGAIGQPLVNYHYWSDLVLADISRIWQIPVLHSFFQYAPLLLSTWTTLLFLYLLKSLGGSTKAVLIALFLLTFGGDAAYLITLILHGTWAQAVSSLDSGVSFYFNIPQVFGRFVFLGALLLLLEWWKKRTWSLGIVIALSLATLFGFKVYYALYAITGFCAVIGLQTLGTFFSYARKNSLLIALRYTIQQLWPAYVVVGLLALACLAIYLPTNSGAGGLVYSFFEWPHLLLSANNINYQDWFLRIQVYEAAGNVRNVLVFNTFAVFLTFVAVYGTRMLGMLPLFRLDTDNWKRLVMFFLPVNILFTVLGLFTLQTSGGLNIFNFLIVPILSYNLFTAITLSRLPNKIFWPVIVLFVLFTLPRTFFQLQHFSKAYGAEKSDLLLSPAELEAFVYLQQNTELSAVVQSLPSDTQNVLTPYIPWLSQRSSYLAGIEMLRSHNQPTEERLANLVLALAATTSAQRNEELRELGITHMLLPTEAVGEAGYTVDTPVFENEELSIFETK